MSRSFTSKPDCARRRFPIRFPKSGSAAASRDHAHYHFAPCLSAHMNLLAEGTPPERIHRVGNTGIDSLRALLAQARARAAWRAHRGRKCW